MQVRKFTERVAKIANLPGRSVANVQGLARRLLSNAAAAAAGAAAAAAAGGAAGAGDNPATAAFSSSE